jgi:hypothetical protein
VSIQDFIKSAAENLGEDEGKMESATGGLLKLIQDQAGEGDFQELLSALPGASSLLSGDAGDGGGGLMGGLAGMAASALGGKASSSLGVLQVLGKSGLDTGQIGPFVSLFFGFLKQKGSGELVGRILGKIPELAKLAG